MRPQITPPEMIMNDMRKRKTGIKIELLLNQYALSDFNFSYQILKIKSCKNFF